MTIYFLANLTVILQPETIASLPSLGFSKASGKISNRLTSKGVSV